MLNPTYPDKNLDIQELTFQTLKQATKTPIATAQKYIAKKPQGQEVNDLHPVSGDFKLILSTLGVAYIAS